MNLAALALSSMLLAGAPKTHADHQLDARTDGGIALTPMDQSNSEQDRKLTQTIRKALMDDERLSFTAKNVKVITQAGTVTLRGLVPNKVERNAVRELAQKAAGEKNVIDQLELPATEAPQNTN